MTVRSKERYEVHWNCPTDCLVNCDLEDVTDCFPFPVAIAAANLGKGETRKVKWYGDVITVKRLK